MSAMLTTLIPSADIPPSANSRACTPRTTATHMRPSHGPDEHRGEHPAEQMSAGAVGDREVQHLHCKDISGRQPGERNRDVGRDGLDPAQPIRNPAGGNDAATG